MQKTLQEFKKEMKETLRDDINKEIIQNPSTLITHVIKGDTIHASIKTICMTIGICFCFWAFFRS